MSPGWAWGPSSCSRALEASREWKGPPPRVSAPGQLAWVAEPWASFSSASESSEPGFPGAPRSAAGSSVHPLATTCPQVPVRSRGLLSPGHSCSSVSRGQRRWPRRSGHRVLAARHAATTGRLNLTELLRFPVSAWLGLTAHSGSSHGLQARGALTTPGPLLREHLAPPQGNCPCCPEANLVPPGCPLGSVVCLVSAQSLHGAAATPVTPTCPWRGQGPSLPFNTALQGGM